MFYRSFSKKNNSIQNRNVFTMSSKYCNMLRDSSSDSDDFSDHEGNAPIPSMIPAEEKDFQYTRKLKVPYRMKDGDSDDELVLAMTKKLYGMDDDQSEGSDSDYNTSKVRPGQSELQIKKGEDLEDFMDGDASPVAVAAAAEPEGGLPPLEPVESAAAEAKAEKPPGPEVEKPPAGSKAKKKETFKALAEDKDETKAPKSKRVPKAKSGIVVGAEVPEESELLKDMNQDAKAERAEDKPEEKKEDGEKKEKIERKSMKYLPADREEYLGSLVFTPEGKSRFVFHLTAAGTLNKNAVEYNGIKLNAASLSDAPSAGKAVSSEQKAQNRKAVAKAFIAMEELADAGRLGDVELYESLRDVLPSKDFLKADIKEARAEKRKYREEHKE